jgi:uncharacterized protein YciI
MLIVDLTYIKPLSEVEKYLHDHREFLSRHYARGNFLASGPKSPRTGGIIVSLVKESTMNTIVQEDPFYIHKIAKYTITPFEPVLHRDEIATLLQKE